MNNTFWADQAIQQIEADFARTAETSSLLALALAGTPNVQLYLKDETTHPTGTIKHRLAHALFVHGLRSGWITQDTPIIEASFSYTTVAEAYFARLLGLRFIVVVSQTISAANVKRIEQYGGECYRVRDPIDIYATAHSLAAELRGHFMDRLTYGVQAVAWYNANNLASSIFEQLRNEPYPQPAWLVCNAGTGSTPAMLHHTQAFANGYTGLCVVDPDPPVLYDYTVQSTAFRSLSRTEHASTSRWQTNKPFLPNTVDRLIKVPNAASFAAMHFLQELIGQRYGVSTGSNLYGALQLMAEMERDGEAGSVVAIMETSSEPDQAIYYDHGWLTRNGYHIEPYLAQIYHFHETGEWTTAVNA